MAIFVVIAARNPKAVGDAISRKVAKHYPVREGVWLVSYDGTTQEVSEELGIKNGTVGSGLVVPVTNYSGRGAAGMWEWLKVNWPDD